VLNVKPDDGSSYLGYYYKEWYGRTVLLLTQFIFRTWMTHLKMF